MGEKAKKRVKKIGQYLPYKYVVAVLIFVVVIVFFGDHNLISRCQTSKKINALKSEITKYSKEIDTNQQKINELHSSNENLEKFAREQYLMKKENEDIFIIDEK